MIDATTTNASGAQVPMASLRDREPHEDHDECDTDIATVLHDVRGERPHVRERSGSDATSCRGKKNERVGRYILRRRTGAVGAL
jgi:hypothetical protein